MYRKVQQADPGLVALKEQCLDIRVQISLLMDKQSHEPTTVAALLGELSALETRICARKVI